jgi:hypothetical protein
MTAGEPGGDDEGGDSDDLASGIVAVQEYTVTVPPKKGFLPWHRPRKQFVRNEQWRHYIAEMLDDAPPSDATLTYFGLPGVDLLDLRFLGSTVCDPRSLKLRFLGFNDAADPHSGDQAELNISLDELSKSTFFDPMSEIVPDDFRHLINEDSIAWQKTLELGPYDVINLDLCDGFGAHPPGQINETYYNAVSKLFAIQARKKTPWLLFLTTRVGRAHVHADTLNRLSKLYAENLKKCEDFQKVSAASFNISDSTSLQKEKQSSFGLQRIFLIGLCKWFLGFVIRQNPTSEMGVKTVLGYRVLHSAEAEDMVSIAIRFDPVHEALEDSSHLASAKPTKPDECVSATSILKRIKNLFDVDAYLLSETAVRDEMIEAMCSLLEAARYDTDEYRRWINT